MISASSDSLIMLWDLNGQGKSLNSYHDHSSEILGLDVCELNPNFFVSASGDTTVKLWDIRDKKACVGTFKDSDSSVNCVKFVPGTYCTLAAGSEEGIINLHDMRAFKTLAQYKPNPSTKSGFGNSINSICFSKSGLLMFASSHNSNIIHYWNLFKPNEAIKHKHTNVIKKFLFFLFFYFLFIYYYLD
jgi:WD40 repeat protein